MQTNKRQRQQQQQSNISTVIIYAYGYGYGYAHSQSVQHFDSCVTCMECKVDNKLNGIHGQQT